MIKKKLPVITIFLGSFLLFGLQPMVGRTLLPSFGGTAAVWVVCLCAYQVLLLAGYFYAHRMTVRNGAAAPARLLSQAAAWAKIHVRLLWIGVLWALAFAFFRPLLKPLIGNSSRPSLEVLICVLIFVGLPYVLLSANASLVQLWASLGEGPQRVGTTGVVQPPKAYRLYGISNLGSFCGLLFYPFILEPFVPLTLQWYGFAVCLALYALLLLRLSASLRATPPPQAEKRRAIPVESPAAVKPSAQILWLLLPATSVFLLNAVTAHLTLDVMPLPLLWVVLLGAFLLSYVIGFRDDTRRWIPIFGVLAMACIGLALWNQALIFGKGSFKWSLTAGLGICFTGCVFLHGWLYGLRPDGAYLTRYYLYNALGGAVGGLLASLVAPLIFDTIAEYPIALFALVGFILAYLFRDGLKAKWRLARLVVASVVLVLVATTGYQAAAYRLRDTSCIYRARGFFGVVRVFERPGKRGQSTGFVRDFMHGTTLHGIEAFFPETERAPTAYFTPDAGGISVVQHPKYKRGEPMRVGLVGMGIGVICAYSRSNDFYRCYEISPEVAKIATNANLFTFISGAPGTVEVVMGDARKELEKERRAQEMRFDVLVIDPFTGDNIPYHMSTREAYQLYFDRLEPDGILAINISNWHLDLVPLMKAIGDAFNCPVGAIQQTQDLGKLRMASMWAFFVPQPPPGFTLPPGVSTMDFRKVDTFPLPTDEKGSFIGLINTPWKR